MHSRIVQEQLHVRVTPFLVIPLSIYVNVRTNALQGHWFCALRSEQKILLRKAIIRKELVTSDLD